MDKNNKMIINANKYLILIFNKWANSGKKQESLALRSKKSLR